nr:MAG TPA: hypothetical protein [Caudoviricetes sp.]
MEEGKKERGKNSSFILLNLQSSILVLRAVSFVSWLQETKVLYLYIYLYRVLTF